MPQVRQHEEAKKQDPPQKKEEEKKEEAKQPETQLDPSLVFKMKPFKKRVAGRKPVADSNKYKALREKESREKADKEAKEKAKAEA